MAHWFRREPASLWRPRDLSGLKSLIEDALRQQQDKQDPQDDAKKPPKDKNQQQGEPGKGAGEGQQEAPAKPDDGAQGSPTDKTQDEQAAQEARDKQADETSKQSEQRCLATAGWTNDRDPGTVRDQEGNVAQYR